jgi:hypothetical protein
MVDDKTKKEVLARAFEAIDRLVGKPTTAVPIIEKPRGNPSELVRLLHRPCSKWVM